MKYILIFINLFFFQAYSIEPNEILDDISPIISSKNFFDPMHQKIYAAIEKLIFGGMLANPITLKNFFESEKDDLNIPDYLIKITNFGWEKELILKVIIGKCLKVVLIKMNHLKRQ